MWLFKHIDHGDAYGLIKIGFQRGSSWSYVGRDALAYARGSSDKSMNFGWDLTTPYGHVTALHEIGHALGFPHEHQSPFAGIVWNTEAVYDYFGGSPNNWSREKTFHNVLRKLLNQEVRGSDWDKDSVMEYRFKAGLITTPEIYQTRDLIPPLQLSAKDIEWVRRFYPPLGAEPPSTLIPFKSSTISLNPGEQRDFLITPAKTRDYTIQTFGLMDVVMALFDQENMSTVKGNDNSGSDTSAIIKANLQEGRSYLLKLRLHYNNDESGSIMYY